MPGPEDIPKRGYLAQVSTVPPLIYPFQYNPPKVTDTRELTWEKREPTPPVAAKSFFDKVSQAKTQLLEGVGLTFSGGAELKNYKGASNRKITFSFVIDGRERRPGEPARRRDDAGDILGDLAVIRSFTYPELANVPSVFSAALSSDPAASLLNQLSASEPPSVVLVLGGTSIEGYITQLKIDQTQFNAKLDPVRAEIEIDLMERVDSFSFLTDTLKRLGRAAYNSAYEDIGDVLL